MARAFCTIFMKSALFFRFEENLRPVSRIWAIWRSKIRFGQNVLRMTWKTGCVQFSWKAHCFSVLKRILGQFHDFENFDAQKCDLLKTCCAWPEKRVLYNFHGKHTVFPFWREFQAKVTILRALTLKNTIWPKSAAHDMKRAFCTIFIKGALFSRFGENFRPAWRLWELWRSKMRFGQNLLRMTWEERVIQFSWKAHCFSPLKRIWGQFHDFENFGAQKSDLAKTCCPWPEKRVLYNFHGRRTVFSFWREFQARVTILKISRSKMRFGQNVLRMTWKERFVQFSWKVHCVPVLTRISCQGADFENFDAQKCDLAKKCCAWREKSVLYNFHEKRTVFPISREFQASVTILRTLSLKNAIWPKRAAHDLKKACCTILMKSALFFRFEENLRPVSRFWKLWR